MSWVSPASFISNLPHVLVGPMLRKVTTDSVSVFVVTKSDEPIVLHIFKYIQDGETPVVMFSDTVSPIKLGDYLYMAVVTADSGSGESLVEGTIYGYDLTFGIGGSLTTGGVLNNAPLAFDSGIDKITFDNSLVFSDLDQLANTYSDINYPSKLPTFSIPPSDLNKLKIVHTSCRKPHGEGKDVFEGIEEKLSLDISDPDDRYHQLFLTGDQIYADDVADALLTMILKTMPHLLSWDSNGDGQNDIGENTPYLNNPVYSWQAVYDNFVNNLTPEEIQKIEDFLNSRLPKNSNSEFDDDLIETIREEYRNRYFIKNMLLELHDNTSLENLAPGGRSNVFAKKCKILPEEPEVSKSHLLKLQEYIGMYLFSWSDVLWGNGLPEFEEVYPNWQKTYTALVDAYYSKVRVKNQNTPVWNMFRTEYDKLITFRGSLGSFRKVVANIPTYMMFDDHEITDDWYLNYQWCKRVLTLTNDDDNIIGNNELSRRILQNGLTAFALFQAWGNTPEQFVGGALGMDLLDKINLTVNNKALPDFSGLDTILGVPIFSDIQQNNQVPITGSSIQWHYQLVFPNYEVLVLDTRTQRGFPENPQKFSMLISEDGLTNQIPDIDSTFISQKPKFTIIVSPAPIVGMPGLEDILLAAMNIDIHLRSWSVEQISDLFADLLVDAGSSDGGSGNIAQSIIDDYIKEAISSKVQETLVIPNLLEFLGQKLREKLDGEAWGYEPRGYENLLARLAERAEENGGVKKGKYVILSGDVHYGFSLRKQYWAIEPFGLNPTNANLVLAQLTASASKNEASLTRLIQMIGGVFFEAYNFGYLIKFGWNNPSGGKLNIGKIHKTGDDTLATQDWEIPDFPPDNPAMLNICDLNRERFIFHATNIFKILLAIVTKKAKFAIEPIKEYLKEGLYQATHLNIPDQIISHPPHWEYRVDIIPGDIKTFTIDEIQIDYDTILNEEIHLEETIIAIKEMQTRTLNLPTLTLAYEEGKGKKIVGRNNFGEVTFAWNDTNAIYKVTQTLWRTVPEEIDMLHSIFDIDLKEDPIDDDGNSLYPRFPLNTQ